VLSGNCFGMRLSDIRWTWPHQRSCDCMSIASMPEILQRSRISVLGSRSCHLVFEILRRKFMWKISSFFMWRRYSAHVSLPYSRDERIAVPYTPGFLCRVVFYDLSTTAWTVGQRKLLLWLASVSVATRTLRGT